ncbi:MAG: hypothetical protein K2X46_05340, partial [Roseomonas sp.]|nr:hypothetical protein [Roseomonas sp.]
MAQLAPIATALGAGASLYSTVRQAQTQSGNARAQAAAAQQQEASRQQQLAAPQAAESRAREARLAGTTAA